MNWNTRYQNSRTAAIKCSHCGLPCGVYDPAQARIEAESVKKIMEKYNESTDEQERTRALFIKEERLELVLHHLWVLWTDFFKPESIKKYPRINDLFQEATKQASKCKTTTDVKEANILLKQIAEITKIFKIVKKKQDEAHEKEHH